jgi:hypothetical protein
MATTTETIIIDTEVTGSQKAEKELDNLSKATNEADEAGKEYTDT